MPLDTEHREYMAASSLWKKCRDANEGQPAILAGSTGAADSYLPRLKKQANDEYAAYKNRGNFYNATCRTIDALVGAIFRRDPVVEASDEVRDDFENINLAGDPLDTIAKTLVADLLNTGRYGLLVDMPLAGTPENPIPPELLRPYWVGYRAEDIIDWRTEVQNGATVLTMVKLKECGYEEDPTDEWAVKEVQRYRVLDLDESGFYRQRIFRLEKSAKVANSYIQEGKDVFPLRLNKRMEFIPFCFFGPLNLSPCVQKPPLLDLVYTNLSHWKLNVDLYHGLHFTALPTPILADKNFEHIKELPIGSGEAIPLSEMGKWGMLEFTGAGLGLVRDALKDNEERMAHLGAEILSPDKLAAEAAQTLRIRSGARSASLSSISATSSWGLSRLAGWHSWWRGESDQQAMDTSITLNQQFVAAGADPAKVTALFAAMQGGGMSKKSFVEFLIREEEVQGRTVDEEMEEIDADVDQAAELADMRGKLDNMTKTVGAVAASMGVVGQQQEVKDAP